jgi:RHS repeat-associated protein
MESIIKGNMQWRFDSCLPIWKLTGQVQQMYVDGQGYVDVVDLNNKTLYASPYLVYNEQGYSKHYYAGAERVSSRIGGGMMQAPFDPLSSPLEHLSEQENWEAIATDLLTMLKRGITCTEFDVDRASMESQLFSIGHSATINDPEENWYIYHSDHLGSSSFLTDASGDPTQHLQYLPFGETFVEQRSVTSYYTPYTFSAKERDPETGYSYFGARYYYSDISVWLSVDPMADVYPMLSPYAYVANNPVMFYDPDGKILALVVTSLANSPGAGRGGHMAIIVGNDDIGYHIFSLELPKNDYINDGKIVGRGNVASPWSLVSNEYVLYSHKEETLEALLEYISENAPGASRNNGNGYDRVLELNNVTAEDEKAFYEYLLNGGVSNPERNERGEVEMDFKYMFATNNCASFSMSSINEFFGGILNNRSAVDIPNAEFSRLSRDTKNWTLTRDSKFPGKVPQPDVIIELPKRPLILGSETYGQ